MNNEVIFQNNDQNQDNPLDQTLTSTPKKIALPTDKRILSLIILGGLIIILFIIALIVTATRKQPQITSEPTPTLVPTEVTTPTKSPIPTEFIESVDSINKSLNFSPEIQPPKIDDTIGL